MFTGSYFPTRYYPPRYFNKGGEFQIPPTQPAGVGGSDQVDVWDRWDNAEEARSEKEA